MSTASISNIIAGIVVAVGLMGCGGSAPAPGNEPQPAPTPPPPTPAGDLIVTYLGGGRSELIRDVAADAAGNLSLDRRDLQWRFPHDGGRS